MLHCRKDYNERIQDSAGIIPDDEPVFLLRAQDESAVHLVRQWAVQYLMDNGNSDPEAQEVYAAVCTHADKMTQWRKKKRADTPKELLIR
jgi:hypothetical protein